MRASMMPEGAERCERGGCVWGDPKGPLGAVALAAMAIKNAGQNRAALDALALKSGDSVLELGCGAGMGLRQALKRVGPAGFVAGVDQSGLAAHVSTHTVHRACVAGRAVVMRAEAADLPFKDAMFDRAFAVNSFQFWPNPARALREVARVLAPRGRLVITQRGAHPERPTQLAGAGRGMERIGQATALLQAQGWNIVDERCTADGARFTALSVIAQRPAM